MHVSKSLGGMSHSVQHALSQGGIILSMMRVYTSTRETSGLRDLFDLLHAMMCRNPTMMSGSGTVIPRKNELLLKMSM